MLRDEEQQSNFDVLFNTVLSNYTQIKTPQDSTAVVEFLIHCYESLENATIRANCLKVVSLPMWSALSATRYEELIQTNHIQTRKRVITELGNKKVVDTVTETYGDR